MKNYFYVEYYKSPLKTLRVIRPVMDFADEFKQKLGHAPRVTMRLTQYAPKQYDTVVSVSDDKLNRIIQLLGIIG